MIPFKNYLPGLLVLSLMGLLLSGCTQAPSEAEQALCECVQSDANGGWDMSLTPECMQRCVEFFGPELEGMEKWFREHCGYDFSHPDPEQEPTRRI